MSGTTSSVICSVLHPSIDLEEAEEQERRDRASGQWQRVECQKKTLEMDSM